MCRSATNVAPARDARMGVWLSAHASLPGQHSMTQHVVLSTPEMDVNRVLHAQSAIVQKCVVDDGSVLSAGPHCGTAGMPS